MHFLVSQKIMQRHFFSTLHPLSPVIFTTATVLAFVLLRNPRFNFHCYTQHEATPIEKSVWKWFCDLSWLLARKITKGVHLCKPASLNRPIDQLPYCICTATRIKVVLRLLQLYIYTTESETCKRWLSVFGKSFGWNKLFCTSLFSVWVIIIY